MSKYLDEMSECQRILRMVARQLTEISAAAQTLGNDRLSDTLYEYVKTIDQTERRIDAAVGQEINDRLADSQASAKATIETALAVALMGKGHEPGCDLLSGGIHCSCSPHKDEG